MELACRHFCVHSAYFACGLSQIPSFQRKENRKTGGGAINEYIHTSNDTSILTYESIAVMAFTCFEPCVLAMHSRYTGNIKAYYNMCTVKMGN
jgi:hypothetical protein